MVPVRPSQTLAHTHVLDIYLEGKGVGVVAALEQMADGQAF